MKINHYSDEQIMLLESAKSFGMIMRMQFCCMEQLQRVIRCCMASMDRISDFLDSEDMASACDLFGKDVKISNDGEGNVGCDSDDYSGDSTDNENDEF